MDTLKSEQFLADVMKQQVIELGKKKAQLVKESDFIGANEVQIHINHFNGLTTETSIQKRIDALQVDVLRMDKLYQPEVAKQMRESIGIYKEIFTGYDQLVSALA